MRTFVFRPISPTTFGWKVLQSNPPPRSPPSSISAQSKAGTAGPKPSRLSYAVSIMDVGKAGGPEARPYVSFCPAFSILAQVSRSGTVRLKTRAPGFESKASAQKYPSRSN
jgi:hypothetical protein